MTAVIVMMLVTVVIKAAIDLEFFSSLGVGASQNTPMPSLELGDLLTHAEATETSVASSIELAALNCDKTSDTVETQSKYRQRSKEREARKPLKLPKCKNQN